MSDDFEKTFSDFLDSNQYDQAEEALFSVVRTAYIAGWKAAGRDVQPSQKSLEVIQGRQTDTNRIE